MLPLEAEAFAVIVTFAVAVKLVPLVGVVRLTVGGEPTVMFTVFEVVVAPKLSVARNKFVGQAPG